MDAPATYGEKIKRCKTCTHYRERDDVWRFPFDKCLWSTATLENPKEDYYEKGNHIRKFNVCYYRCGDHEGIEEPMRFMIIYGRDLKEVELKFNHAYRHLEYTFGFAEAIDMQ